MTDIKELIKKLREKPYYIKLINILVINGLLDIVEDELEDGKIDYFPLMINLIKFLNKNKNYYKNFSSNTFEKILILSIDEILTKKFNTEIDEDNIILALELLKNSYLFKSLFSFLKDIYLKFYYKCIHNNCCNSVTDVNEANEANKVNVIVDIQMTEPNKFSEQDNI
jgi:hypothetical protein